MGRSKNYMVTARRLQMAAFLKQSHKMDANRLLAQATELYVEKYLSIINRKLGCIGQ